MADTFALQIDDEQKRTTPIKWQQVNTKYEVHVHTLDTLELAKLLPHCLDVLDKVLSVVGTEAHKGPSLFRVFPRTLSTPIRAMYEVTRTDFAAAGAEQAEETEDNFRAIIKIFISIESTPDDQHELRHLLMTSKKPCIMSVQAYYYRLRELNTYVTWLPGNENPLSEEELKLGLHQGMPEAWTQRLVTAGKSHHAMTQAELNRYFHAQEQLAAK